MDQLGNKPDQEDLVDWTTLNNLSIPVLADTNFSVGNRFLTNYKKGGIPNYTLLGPGAVVKMAYEYWVTAQDIEDALPSTYAPADE